MIIPLTRMEEAIPEAITFLKERRRLYLNARWDTGLTNRTRIILQYIGVALYGLIYCTLSFISCYSLGTEWWYLSLCVLSAFVWTMRFLVNVTHTHGQTVFARFPNLYPDRVINLIRYPDAQRTLDAYVRLLQWIRPFTWIVTIDLPGQDSGEFLRIFNPKKGFPPEEEIPDRIKVFADTAIPGKDFTHEEMVSLLAVGTLKEYITGEGIK